MTFRLIRFYGFHNLSKNYIIWNRIYCKQNLMLPFINSFSMIDYEMLKQTYYTVLKKTILTYTSSYLIHERGSIAVLRFHILAAMQSKIMKCRGIFRQIINLNRKDGVTQLFLNGKPKLRSSREAWN